MAPRAVWPRRLALGLLPLLGLLLVGELLWFAPFDQAAPLPARDPQPLPLAAVNPLGAHVFLEREVDSFKKEKTAELLRDSGLHWIKQEFPWSELEFAKNHYVDDKNGKISWAKFDAIVAQARDNGLEVIARLDRAPAWAQRPGANPEAPPAKVRDFGDFVANFVTRYKGQIHFLQIWNEPNLDSEWNKGQPVSPGAYVALLKEAHDRAREVDPDIVILSAPLAPTNENFHLTPNATSSLRETNYLDEMYTAGAAPYFDIAAANAFGYNSPPEEAPAPDTYNFRRLELTRQVMVKHGDAQKPIWITEYAWNAPDTRVLPAQQIQWGKVTLAQQADYTVRGIEYARSHWSWAGVFVIWYFRQVGDIAPTDGQYYFGMVTPDFVPQPIYHAVQVEAAALAVAGPGPVGPLSTAVQPGPGWGLHIARPAAGSGGPSIPLLVSQAPTTTLRMAFRGTDLALTLAAPAAVPGKETARIYVTVDDKTDDIARDLPRDEAGKPYIAGPIMAAAALGGAAHEAAPGAAAQAVALVTGLGDQRAPAVHQVQLRASGVGATIAGFTVASTRSYLLCSLATGLLLALLAVDLAVLWRGRREQRA